MERGKIGENERDEESVRMKKIEIEMCDSRNWEHEQQQQEKRPEPEHCRRSKNEKNQIQTEKEHARKATLNGYIM